MMYDCADSTHSALEVRIEPRLSDLRGSKFICYASVTLGENKYFIQLRDWEIVVFKRMHYRMLTCNYRKFLRKHGVFLNGLNGLGMVQQRFSMTEFSALRF